MAPDKLNEKLRVLLVDDEPDVLQTLEELLEDHHTTRAASFNEAKRLMDVETFDVAVLDIMGVDGYTLLDIANRKDIPAVMLTAHALSPENTVKSFQKGASFFVPKEKMSRIPSFIKDILDAKRKGEHSWSTWLKNFDTYYTQKFGPEWKEENKEFWDAIEKLDWRLASSLRRKEENKL